MKTRNNTSTLDNLLNKTFQYFDFSFFFFLKLQSNHPNTSLWYNPSFSYTVTYSQGQKLLDHLFFSSIHTFTALKLRVFFFFFGQLWYGITTPNLCLKIEFPLPSPVSMLHSILESVPVWCRLTLKMGSGKVTVVWLVIGILIWFIKLTLLLLPLCCLFTLIFQTMNQLPNMLRLGSHLGW